jgi:branched-chain amino acid transport system substrate-binding protein
MKRIITFIVILSLVVVAVLTACQKAAAPTPVPTAVPTTPAAKPVTPAPTTPAPKATTPAPPIKIGLLIPLTGGLLHEGPAVRKGAELALEHYGGVVAGRKIEYVIEDSATDPTTALDKARKLVEKDGVPIIIGPQHSGVTQAVQPYLMEKKIISLKSRQFPIPLTQKFPYLFVVDGTQQQVTAPMGDYVFNELKFKTATTLTSDYVAGREFMAGFVNRFKEIGGTIVQEQFAPVDAMDWAPYLSNLKAADVFVAWTGGPGGPRLLKQWVEYGINKKMPLHTCYISGILNEDTLPGIGDICIGAAGPSSYASTVDNPLNKKVVADYRRKYNERPADSGIMGGYVNAQVAFEALKATNGDTNPDKLKEAIMKLRIDTPAGPIRFNQDKLGILNVYICKVAKEGGEYFWQVVKTYENVMPR